MGVRACNLTSVEHGGFDFVAGQGGKTDVQRIAVVYSGAVAQCFATPLHSERTVPVCHQCQGVAFPRGGGDYGHSCGHGVRSSAGKVGAVDRVVYQIISCTRAEGYSQHVAVVDHRTVAQCFAAPLHGYDASVPS